MPDPSRILVVRLDNLGDHVLGSGIFGALRRRYPKATIDALVPDTLTGLYQRCPHGVRAGSALPDANFDLVVNPRFAEDYYRAAELCGALSAPGARIVGFRQTQRLPGTDPNGAYTELIEASDTWHTARYAALAAAACGADGPAWPESWHTREDFERVSMRWALTERGYVVVGLGASFPFKCPPVKSYQRVLDWLGRRGIPVVLTGTAQAREIAGQLRGLTAQTCGMLELPELTALLAHARAYAGPDSGPKHLAAASGIPVLELAWVGPAHPVRSRGPGTAGACWRAWQTVSETIHPPHLQSEIDAALEQLLR